MRDENINEEPRQFDDLQTKADNGFGARECVLINNFTDETIPAGTLYLYKRDQENKLQCISPLKTQEDLEEFKKLFIDFVFSNHYEHLFPKPRENPTLNNLGYKFKCCLNCINRQEHPSNPSIKICNIYFHTISSLQYCDDFKDTYGLL